LAATHCSRDRLTDIEALADADGTRRGSNPCTLARALLTGDLRLRPVACSYAADRHVARLPDTAAGVPTETTDRIPWEWLPVALLATVVPG